MPIAGTGSAGRIYVSGSYLFWEDGLVTVDSVRKPAPQAYKFLGALPDPPIFSGQSPGRIWVTSGSGDTALYYADEIGTTRFIPGRKRGPSSASPLGRIYAHRYGKAFDWEGIQPATDLFWTAYSGSTITWFSVKNDDSYDPKINLELNIATYGDKGMVLGLYEAGTANLATSNFDIAIRGPGVRWYSSSNCTGTELGVNQDMYVQYLDDTILPAGKSVLYYCPQIGDGGNSTGPYYGTTIGVNPCPPVNILGQYPANSWRVDPYTGQNNPPRVRGYIGTTMTTMSQNPGLLYYTSSESQTDSGSLYYQTWRWPNNTNLGSSSTGDFWSISPMSVGIDRVALSFSDLNCSGDPGSGGCSAGSGSCGGNCYALATQGCCAGTIYEISMEFCCAGVLGQYAQSEFCCGGGIFVNDGINYTGLCCGGNACGPTSTQCINNGTACEDGTQP